MILHSQTCSAISVLYVSDYLISTNNKRETLVIQLLMLNKCPSPQHTGWVMFSRATLESRLSRTVTELNIYYKQGWLTSKMLMSMYSRRLHSTFHSRSVQEKSCQGCLFMKQVGSKISDSVDRNILRQLVHHKVIVWICYYSELFKNLVWKMYEHSSQTKQLFRTAGGPLLSYQHVNIARLPILGAALMTIYRQKYIKKI